MPQLNRDQEDTVVTLPREWNPAWGGRSRLCDNCLESVEKGSNSCCMFCNVVCYAKCLLGARSGAMGTADWVCDNCQQDMVQYKEDQAQLCLMKAVSERQSQAQQTIVAWWRGTLVRVKLKKILASVVSIQNCVRTHLFSHYFRKLQRNPNAMRPAKVTIKRCQNLPVVDWDTGKCDPYVLVAVVGPFGTQTWLASTRVITSSLNPVFDQQLLLPAVSQRATLYITVIDQDISPKCEQRPRTASGQELSLNYSVVGTIANDNDQKAGHIEFNIEHHNTLAVMCGFVIGPSIELRSGRGLGYVLNANLHRRLLACIYEGDLILYKHHGALNGASFTVPLQSARVSFHKGQKALRICIEVGKTGGGKLDRDVSLELSIGPYYERTRWQVAIGLALSAATSISHASC
jgi:hypothetical protein